jgi:hypothetical protein
MLLLTWKYAFSINPYSLCNSRIYHSQCPKGFWGNIRKERSREKREEKVRRERERKGQVSY